MTSFSPVITIGRQISEVVELHEGLSKNDSRDRAIEALRMVGMPRPEQQVDSYPFNLSGGMRQRAMIAMALVCRPSLIIADEPTSALDVTIQAQILQLLRSLQDEQGTAVMMITHDLGVVAESSDRVMVMYLGESVEEASVDDLFHNPRHPYTIGLMKSIPRFQGYGRVPLEPIRGNVPSLLDRPGGCPFHTRCDRVIDGLCASIAPYPTEVEPGHVVRCHLYGKGV
jgi:oligopeptide/dipeptide ABC transporter ATP-binding protein